MLDRYVCDALQELRDAHKLLDAAVSSDQLVKSALLVYMRHSASLIEEIQTSVNRMENELRVRGKVENLREDYKDLKKSTRDLRMEARALKDSIDVLEEEQRGLKHSTSLLRINENTPTKKD